MKQNIISKIVHLTDYKCYFWSLGNSNRFKTKPPRGGQPLYKGQRVRPQSVLCSEILLYMTLQYECASQYIEVPNSLHVTSAGSGIQFPSAVHRAVNTPCGPNPKLHW